VETRDQEHAQDLQTALKEEGISFKWGVSV